MRLNALAALLALPTLASAGTSNFTAGNFVAVRAGDGTAALVNNGRWQRGRAPVAAGCEHLQRDQ